MTSVDRKALGFGVWGVFGAPPGRVNFPANVAVVCVAAGVVSEADRLRHPFLYVRASEGTSAPTALFSALRRCQVSQSFDICLVLCHVHVR